MKDSKLYQDLMTLLSLIRSCQSSSINQILPQHLKKQQTSFYSTYTNLQHKIQQIIFKHCKQNGELVIKFWITLRQIIKIFLQKIKLIDINSCAIVRKYNCVSEMLFRNIENKTELSKLRYVIDVLKNISETDKLTKYSSDKKDSLKDKEGSKPSRSPSKKLQKRHNNNLTRLLDSRKDLYKVIQNSIKTNNKLFRSIDARLSLEKYDNNLNRSSNSHLLFNELYSRNKHAHKSITKYHNKSSSIPKEALVPEQNNHHESVYIVRKQSSKICKSVRKPNNQVNNQPILTFQINVISNKDNKKADKTKSRPQSCKPNKRKQLDKKPNTKGSIKHSYNLIKQNILV